MSMPAIRDTIHSVTESCGRRIHDVEIDPSHMPKAMVLPGMNITWQPQATTVEDALSDIHSLLAQAKSVFMEANDLPLPQWSAFQQLSMALGLLEAVHETMIKLRVVGE